MAGDNKYNNILDKISPKGNDSLPTNEEIANYTPQNMSPDQIAAYKQSQEPTSTGALNVHDYYPDAYHNINVGNYSGDQIGSTTLFAPGGGLVPLGMMDARDLAAQKAAMAKAKELEDFNKKYEAPSTKHVAVQKEMTNQYIDQLNQWKVNALKKSGGNQAVANKMLESDPTFNKWNKNWQDTKNLHDTLVGHAAELEASEKDPNFVLSPQTRKAKQDMMSGLAYQEQNPFDTKGHNTSLEFLRSRANYDLDKASNTAIEKAIPDIEQLPAEYKTRGKNEVMTLLEKEYFKPERIDEISDNLYREKYYGTDISKDQVKDRVKSLLGEKIKRHVEHYDKYFKPDNAGNETTYETAVPQTKTAFNVNSGTAESPNVKSIYAEKAYKTSATDEKKEISIPINKDMQDVQGANIKSGTGNVKGTVSGIHLSFFDKTKNQYLTDEEAKHYNESHVKSHNIVKKPVAVFNMEPTAAQKEAGEQGNTLLIPAEELKGKFKNGKKKSGQQDFDDKITELENDSHTHNETVKEAAKKAGSGTHFTVKGKEYTADAVDKAAKASGMSRDEYLIAIGK